MNKKYRSVGVNAILNTIKSGMSILFPLITYPYAFRVLHAVGMGKVDYANSIIGYFSLIATLGINSYAVREGAKVRDNRDALERFSCQIFSINVLSTLLAYILLFLCVFFVPQLKSYGLLIMLLGLSMGFDTLGIEWVNTIYEDYLYITIRSVVTHAISLTLLFVVVRRQEDYYYYALLSVITRATICLMNWLHCRKYLDIRLTLNLGLVDHFKPVIILFANRIATTIYVCADTTMLGIMSGDATVGLYSIAAKIYGVMKNLLVSMYSVTIPRIAYYWGKGEITCLRNVYSKLLSNLIIILLPASIGIICIANEIIFFMGGEEYSDAVLTLQILSVALVGAILGGAVTYCLNIPIGLEKYNLMATIISAIINIGLNVFIIPVFKQNGAAFTTAVSEFFVLLFCVVKNKRFWEFIDLGQIKKNLFHATLGVVSIIMISNIVHLYIHSEIVAMMLIIVIGCVSYLCELLTLKNEIAFMILGKIKDKLSFNQNSG